MSAQDFGVVAIYIPNPVTHGNGRPRVVNATIGFQYEADNSIATLSSTNPSGVDAILALLYVPDISDAACANLTSDLIPSNVTTLASFPPNSGFPLLGIAPWTTPQCTQQYLAQMRMDAVKAAVFFPTENTAGTTPQPNDPIWSLNDGGRWRTDNQFPVYAVPYTVGTHMMQSLSLYSGNMTDAPFGAELADQYGSANYVRLYTRIDLSLGGNSGIPSLWVFLIIVLAILLGIVICSSITMHFVQRRRRRALQRRVERGEIDLESLGIKRMNVPQDKLDEMPCYRYTTKSETATGGKEAVGVIVPAGGIARESAFSQPTCSICLDDFTHQETVVRELPCRHIYHPDCIDPFLRDNSSLCPMCKKSALPAGYCPVQVTNLMVRRERLMRRMRERRQANIRAAQRQNQPETRYQATMAVLRRTLRVGAGMPSAPGPVPTSSQRQTNASEQHDVEMGDVSTPAVRDRRRDTEMPPEIANQGREARRAWRQERFARQQARTYEEQAETARQVDEGRPFWRRAVGRILPGID